MDNTSIIADINTLLGSIYRLNDRRCKYYLFNTNPAGRKISTGMFFQWDDKKLGYTHCYNLNKKELLY